MLPTKEPDFPLPQAAGSSRFLIFMILCLIMVGVVISFSWRIPPPPPPSEVKSDPLLAKGYDIYMRQCVACHGLKGLGDGPRAHTASLKPRNLRDEPWKYGDDPDSVRKIITQGGPQGGMPGFGPSLSPQDLRAIVIYVRHLGGKVRTDENSIGP